MNQGQEKLTRKDPKRREAKFLTLFQSVPQTNSHRLSKLAQQIIDVFNGNWDDAPQRPFERQEDLGYEMKSLLREQISIIEARRVSAMKMKRATAGREKV